MEQRARRDTLHALRRADGVERLLAALPPGAATGPYREVVDELIALARRPGPPQPKTPPPAPPPPDDDVARRERTSPRR
jgi:hypothetical protein